MSKPNLRKLVRAMRLEEEDRQKAADPARLLAECDKHIKELRQGNCIWSDELAMKFQIAVHGKPWDPCLHPRVHRMVRIGIADDRFGCDTCSETFMEQPDESEVRR